MKKIKQICWSILNFTFLGGLVQLRIKSSLLEDGWFKSFQQKEAIDNDGNPIAWCTYPFIHFMTPRLKKNFNVFEYGCGNSTMWYASQVQTVTAVEHHKGWFDKIQSKMPANATVIFQELVYGGDYCKAVLNSNIKYHIVVVDGRDRNNCLLNAMNSLTDDGVVIFDNSDLKQYQVGITTAMEKGFKKIDFYGMLPIVAHQSATTIFYKSNNCLGI
jgi:hypothetical protein